jgi:hypothetical protein
MDTPMKTPKHKDGRVKELCQRIKRDAFEIGTTVLFLAFFVKFVIYELGK